MVHLRGLLSSWDSNFKVEIQDSLFVKGGIQDSNLNPRKMAEIKDSNLVFKGPYSPKTVYPHGQICMDASFKYTFLCKPCMHQEYPPSLQRSYKVKCNGLQVTLQEAGELWEIQ